VRSQQASTTPQGDSKCRHLSKIGLGDTATRGIKTDFGGRFGGQNPRFWVLWPVIVGLPSIWTCRRRRNANNQAVGSNTLIWIACGYPANEKRRTKTKNENEKRKTQRTNEPKRLTTQRPNETNNQILNDEKRKTKLNEMMKSKNERYDEIANNRTRPVGLLPSGWLSQVNRIWFNDVFGKTQIAVLSCRSGLAPN
jgi:hypothetical protein